MSIILTVHLLLAATNVVRMNFDTVRPEKFSQRETLAQRIIVRFVIHVRSARNECPFARDEPL
jgi:hypothetical protein